MEKFDWEGLANMLLDEKCEIEDPNAAAIWLMSSGYTFDDLEYLMFDWKSIPELKAYHNYLEFWKKDHQGPEFEGMEPVCYSEFEENEYEEHPELYNDPEEGDN